MRCAKQARKQIFIMLTYTNIIMKEHYLKLWCSIMLNIDFEQTKGKMRGPTSIYTPLGTQLKKTSKKVFMCASSKIVF